MNNNHNSRFSEGFFLGLILGAALVFLLGTKQGKNLLKILQDQGIEGISDMLKEYDLGQMEEEDLSDQDIVDEDIDDVSKASNREDVQEYKVEEKPRKRFFKRFKKSN